MAATQTENEDFPIEIRTALDKDLKSLWDISGLMKHAKDPDYFEQQLEMQKEGNRVILIASVEGEDIGYCLLNWLPKYGFFKTHNIPEIQDLNVIPGWRERGFGTAMILHCEDLATFKGYKQMGISFGLHPGFGSAQYLYIKLGYKPDGFGVTYDRKIVQAGEFKPIDDQLCLMLVKNLG